MFVQFRSFHILFFLLLTVSSFGQVITNVRHYSTADGLSDNRVTSVIKDQEGFMWFSSWSGLTRFDGQNFLVFKSDPGQHSQLRSSRIDEVVDAGKAGFLWLRGYGNVVYRFNKRSQKFESLNQLSKNRDFSTISFTRILSVTYDAVWLESKQGIFLIDNANGAQPSIIQFGKGLVKDHQLPSNKLVFFHLDKQSNAWIGTDRGLRVIRRKGKSSLSTVPGQGNKVFTAIAEDKGSIWLAGNDGTLSKIRTDLQVQAAFSISESRINSLCVSTREKALYCSTETGVLFRMSYDGKKKELGHVNDKSPLRSIYQDRFGDLWIESPQYGLLRFSYTRKALISFFPRGNYTSSSVRNVDLFEDRNGTVWLNLHGVGLRFFSRKDESLHTLTRQAGGAGQSLFRVKFRHYYDPAGVLWLLPDEGGVEKVVFKELNFNLYKPAPASSLREDNEIRSLFTGRDNKVWAGTKSGHIFLYQQDQSFSRPFINSLAKNGVYALAEDRSGNLWIGTKAEGLIRARFLTENGRSRYLLTQYLPNKADSFSISHSSIYCLLKDSRNRLWAGTFEQGLVLIEQETGTPKFRTVANTFKNYPVNTHGRIRTLAEDVKGRIWVGTTQGLLVFDPNRGRPNGYVFHEFIKKSDNIHSLAGNDIQHVFRDSRNRMWLLSSTGGLSLASESADLHNISFGNYSTKSGLPNDFLISCTQDNMQNLWISTQNGISRFSLTTGRFQNFNVYDGLPDVSFSESAVTRTATGHLLFGTTTGILDFNPDSIRSRRVDAQLALLGLEVNSEPLLPGADPALKESINTTKAVELKYDQNSISIDFAMLDYHSMNKQVYYCRLLGYDDTWRNSERQRRATYTKLPPGKYVFQVKCVNDEIYGRTPLRALAITIHPPLWKTWWAYALYCLLTLILLFFARKLLLSFLQLRQKVQIEREVSELKLNFFTQISHELRTPLTLIVNPAEEVIKDAGLSDRSKQYLASVVKNARRMVRLVNQLLDLRKVQSGKATLKISTVEIVSFVEDIGTYFTDTLRNRDLSLNFSSDVPALSVGIDAEKMDIVLYNLLANAIKFSPDGSVIKINIQAKDPGSVRIEVSDEGPGVPENELKEIFKLYFEGTQQPYHLSKGTGIGLALSRELVQLHGGRIYAEPNTPKGLRVILEIATQEADFDAIQLERLQPREIFDTVTESEHNEEASADKPLIVLVEDNEELRTFLAAGLSEFYRVQQAKDGQEGLELAISVSPDLVLSDVMMPRMDGVEMLDRLKNDPDTSHIPVILLTARHSVESQIMSLNFGADYYITKPFQMPLLKAAISNLIKARKKLFQHLQDNEPAPSFDYSVISAYDKAFLEKVIAIVDEKLSDSTFNVDDFADTIGMSRSGFFRKFKSLTNVAPVEFVREARLKKSKELFLKGNDNISEVAYAVGFTTPRYFSTCFKAQFGQTPREYLADIKKATDHSESH